MERAYEGYFISFEGGEGSGKTSHMPAVTSHLRTLGLKVFPTREPGGTSIGEQIREVLFDDRSIGMHPRCETLLFQAARVQMTEQVIIPKLVKGEIVLIDRYSDSTRAYQGFGCQQDIEQINRLIEYATGGLIPDLTVLFDIDAELGLGRKHSSRELNRMEALPLEFHERVNAAYLEMARQDPNRWVIIDARRSIDQVGADLIREINLRLQSAGYIERNSRGVER